MILAAFVVLCVFLLATFVQQAKKNSKKKQYTAVSHAVLINGEPYGGRALFISPEGEEYIPLDELSSRFGVEEVRIKRKTLYWGEQEYPIEEGDVLQKMDWGGPSCDFIRTGAVSDILGLSVFSDASGVCSIDNYPSLNYTWSDSLKWIGISLGGIDEYTGTNCREAFDYNYKQGIRLFEADLALTSDNVPVAVADWKAFRKMCGIDDAEEGPLKEEDFLASKIHSDYTPMSYEDICGLLASKEDMYLIVNVKDLDAETAKKYFSAFLEEAGHFDASIFDRIIPQVSAAENCDVVMGLRDWDSAISVLDPSQESMTVRDAIKHSMEKGIRLFAIDSSSDDDYLIETIHKMGGKVYLRSCDDAKEAASITESKGVDGFYTNFVIPKDVAQ